MNENAAAEAPHLLFGPVASLESLQRFKWHPIRASALEQTGGKHSVPALLKQNALLQMMALGVKDGHVT